ncbi:Hypothetical Protein OBI_RACECAR_70 [Arthrobacter phage Racecar]|nr:hypothetical protein PBI_RACECAR_152 [Arthrobacter phage Racecar]QFG12826.1 hypothetical protein PBI_MIMI_149 [Arthrobacter phage Mimi]
MGWWIALDVVLYIAAIVTMIYGLWWPAFICFILALALTLILSGGKSDLPDFFEIFD